MSITCRRGNVRDIAKLLIADDLELKAESIEFNVGIGHEFWIAVEENRILAVMVLRRRLDAFNILYIRVARSRVGQGIGSSLVQAVLKAHPACEFSVIPFTGTEGFYHKLGFKNVRGWEMCRIT